MKNIEFDTEHILNLDKNFRIDLINSITGIKSAHLISTVSGDGIANLAIFSSIVHLGSNPPLIGFILRPETRKLSDTMQNIKTKNYYTINSISPSIVKKAHKTSQKIGSEISEFDHFNIEKEYIDNIPVPFVKESSVKIGLSFKEKIDINLNNTSLIIGEIDCIKINKNILDNYGRLNITKANSVGVTGVDMYYYSNELIDLKGLL